MDLLIPGIIFLLIIAALVALPVIIMQLYLFRLGRVREKIEPLKKGTESAVWAHATIISVQGQDLRESTRTVTRIELRLEVARQGGEKYQATTIWLVNMTILPKLQPGEEVPVKIDPRDPRVIYPNMQGAEYYYWG